MTATNDLSEGPASDPVTFKTGSGELPPEITIDAPEKPAKVLSKNYHSDFKRMANKRKRRMTNCRWLRREI